MSQSFLHSESIHNIQHELGGWRVGLTLVSLLPAWVKQAMTPCMAMLNTGWVLVGRSWRGGGRGDGGEEGRDGGEGGEKWTGEMGERKGREGERWRRGRGEMEEREGGDGGEGRERWRRGRGEMEEREGRDGGEMGGIGMVAGGDSGEG